LHEEFFETTYKQLNVFIAGTGNVGGKLSARSVNNSQYLQNDLRLQIQVIGLANSKKILINEDGISLDTWKDAIAGGARW
jgi:aspartokinase/homoserine dehydrogenase 1